MAANHALYYLDLVGILQLEELDHLQVAVPMKIAGLIEHIGDAARHTRGEVPSRGAKHHHAPARHVLAAMIADRLDYGVDAAVAHTEALARHAADVRLAAGSPIEGDVADDHVLFR